MKVNVVFADGTEVETVLDGGNDYTTAIKKFLYGKLLILEDGTVFNLDMFLRIDLLEQNKKQKSK